MERKIIGQIQGSISSRRLVCNATIQDIVIDLYTKYDYSSLHDCGEILDEKFEGGELKEGRRDGRTDVNQ